MVIDLVLARAILIQYRVLKYHSSRKLETDYLQKRTRPLRDDHQINHA